MIFFAGNDGSIISSFPSPVYQGGANANTVYLVAPFASNSEVTVAFKLPNGGYTARKVMTPVKEIQGVINAETGSPYSGWQFSMPNEITAYYGTVTAQFYFYAAQTGKILASSSTSFVVGRGVPEIPPAEPTDDVYDTILSNITALREQLENGTYAARAIYSYNSEYVYGAGELVFYPNRGEYGTFLKSLVTDNNNAPYVNGELNSAYWEEVIDFDILNGLYAVRDEVTKRAEEAAGSAAAAESSAENAGNSASAAAGSAAEAKAAADSVESSAKYLEDIKSGAEAVNKALNDGTGANIAGQFAAVNSDMEGLREDINTESHFRGMFASVEALRAAYPTATPNDYAYIVGGNIYIWENDAWTDSGEPSPNTSVPASNSIPLMDGTGSAGVSSQYARGDHRHPGDTTKASVTSLNAETAARESADTELGTRIDGNETDIAALQSGKVSKSGDKMTGPLNLPQGQQARGYKDAGVTFEYSNKNPSGFYSSVFARYDKCFVCGEGEDKAILQYDYNDGWHARVSNNGAEELSVLWMDKNGHLLDNGSRVSLREDRETEQKYAKYINTTPGSSYTKIATVKAEEPSLLTVYGMETSEMGGIIISNEPSLRGGTEWSHTPNADELARVEGEQGYWGKQYLCCTVLIAKGATVYVWGRYITNLYYTLQPVFKKEG